MAVAANDTIAVTAVGLVTSLALDCASSAAAARAGLTRPRELDYLVTPESTNEPEPLVGYPLAGGLADGFEGIGRLMRIAQLAYDDFKREIDPKYLTLPTCGWIVALSEPKHWRFVQSGLDEKLSDDEINWNVDGFRAAFEAALDVDFHDMNFSVVAAGHASVAIALGRALEPLRTGQWDRCVVCAIDSLVEPTVLAQFDAEGRLKTEDNPVGLRPGEAGGFVLLETVMAAKRRDVTVTTTIAETASAVEPDHFNAKAPGLGRGMSEVVHALRAMPMIQHPPTIVLDLNGEVYRSNDWGNALVRSAATFPVLRDADVTYPATLFGDTGAASGIVALCLAVQGMRRDYWHAEHTLILSSSDNGSRGGILAQRVSNGA